MFGSPGEENLGRTDNAAWDFSALEAVLLTQERKLGVQKVSGRIKRHFFCTCSILKKAQN